MINFLDWLNTSASGHEYMTLIECAMEDFYVVYGLTIERIIIISLYLTIVYLDARTARKFKDSLIKKEVFYKNGLFVFCSVCGYLIGIIALYWNSYKLWFFVHLFLIGFTIAYVRKLMKSKNMLRIYTIEQEMMQKQKDYLAQIEAAMLKSLTNEKGDLIKYEDVQKLQEGKKYPLGKASWFTPVDLKNEVLHLFMFLAPGEGAGLHHHDCYEKLINIEGELIDTVKDEKVKLGVGGEAIIDKGDKHNPYSEKGSKTNCYLSRDKFK